MLARPRRAVDVRQPLRRVGRSERQIQAEERVAVAELGFIVPVRCIRAVQADRHLDADGADIAVMLLQPPPERPRHDREDGVVEGRAVGRLGDPVKPVEVGGRKCHRPLGVDRPVKWRAKPRMRGLAGEREQAVASVANLLGPGARVRVAAPTRVGLIPQRLPRDPHRGGSVGERVVDPPYHRASPARRRGSTSIRHSGRERSRRCSKSSATRRRRPSMSSGPASSVTTCSANATSASGYQQRTPATSSSRSLSSGATSSRDAIDTRRSAALIVSSRSTTLQVCPATVSHSSARISRSSSDKGRSRCSAAPPVPTVAAMPDRR